MKICLVALNIYPMLARDYRSEKIGGAELQQINIARSLSAQGHEVFVVCLDHGQPDAENIEGVIALKTFREKSGIRVLRFFHPRLTSLWAALRRADCDVYYCRAAGFHLGIQRFFRQRTGKPYVFAGALDTDFVPNLVSIENFRDRLLYDFGLRGADRIIVQSDRQRALLAAHHGLDGVVLANFLNEGRKPLPRDARRNILWVSSIRNRKRPLHFVRLAQRFPEERFIMAGGRLGTHPGLYDEVAAAARDVPNLEFLGFQPYERVEALFDECRLFVNTSLYEGFPNTFLQAWRRNIPVVSFVDPDDVIRRHALGKVVTSEDELAEAVGATRETFDRYVHAGEYFLAHHSARIGEQLGRILESAIVSAQTRARPGAAAS